MRCLDRLGANLVIQDEANPGRWTGPDGNGIEQWQPLSWMSSTYRTVGDPSVHFDYNVTAMMVGNLADFVFDGQSAITQRRVSRGARCHYIGNRAFVPGEDQSMFRRYAGPQPDFLALAPWVVGDRSRAALRLVGDELAPGSGSRLENDYLETALIADLPFPVDRRRTSSCRSGRRSPLPARSPGTTATCASSVSSPRVLASYMRTAWHPGTTKTAVHFQGGGFLQECPEWDSNPH